ncbi:HNH endonuclease family protein [Candidatus Poriferisodalis sp.]|uniref:HNH endonuclease family protein n=1 Tax=Candidatus Poriferisodalis sp. TaxID=3101277 RepID=UPI003B02258E
MKITPIEVTVRELVDGYSDDTTDGAAGAQGVWAYDGLLCVRPSFQREFVYKPKQQVAVIDTLRKGHPLNVMYWADCGDGTYEMLDGQQRTISIARYADRDFSHDGRFFDNLSADEQEQVLDYRLSVYVCEGSEDDKIAWFKTINFAGEQLKPQELLNAVFRGPWLEDAKAFFSRPNAAAGGLADGYVKGSPIRQELLRKALEWISGGDVQRYMGQHQHAPDASELREHFRTVVGWAKSVFPTVRPGITDAADWGTLWSKHGDSDFDAAALDARVAELIDDDEIRRQAGICPYLLTDDERHLQLRTFDDSQKRRAYERQDGICVKPDGCGEHFAIGKMHGDHITPWSAGGKTTDDNCQMLCADCNRQKGAR